LNKNNREETTPLNTTPAPNESESLKDFELDDTKIILKVIRDYENDKEARKDWNINRELIYERYRQRPVRKVPFDGASNIVVPTLQSNIDSLLPRVNSAFLGKKPPVAITGTEENDKDQANIVEKFFNKSILEMGYEDMINDMNASTALYGTAFIKDMLEDEKIMVKTIDGNDIFLPFNATCDLNDMAHVIHRWYRDRWWCSQRYDIPLEKFGKYEKIPEGIQEIKDDMEGRINVDEDFDQPVECIEWYGRWIIKGEMKDVVFVVAYKERILLAKWFLNEVVPYADDKRRLPINRVHFKKVSGCAYGVGLGEDLSGMHDWTNSVVNAILDGNYWSIIPWGIKREGSKLNVSDIKVKFGMMLNVPDMGDIDFKNMPNNTAPMVQMLPYIQAATERVASISDYGMGRESSVAGSSATATGTKAVISEMMVRLDGYINKASKDLKYTLENLYYWQMARIDEYEIQRTLGTVDSRDIDLLMENAEEKLKYDLNINVNSGYHSRDSERQTNLEVYQMTQTNPQLASNPKFSNAVTKDLLDGIGKERLSDELDGEGKEATEQYREIGLMLQGSYEIPLENDNHTEHRRVIAQYKSSGAYEGTNDASRQMIEQHDQQHAEMLDQLKMQVLEMNLMGGQAPDALPQEGQPQGMPQMPQQPLETAEGM